jgi:hypothetical protein
MEHSLGDGKFDRSWMQFAVIQAAKIAVSRRDRAAAPFTSAHRLLRTQRAKGTKKVFARRKSQSHKNLQQDASSASCTPDLVYGLQDWLQIVRRGGRYATKQAASMPRQVARYAVTCTF